MSDTQRPLVSLLMPICNVEKYLEQCLASACAQTLRDLEIICINDGSTDGSLAIIQSFAARDERIRIIDKPNSGYGDSMNRGLETARGRYVAILESDDFLDPEALEYMAERCERERLDLLKCNFYLYWSNPGAEQLNRHNLYFSAVSPEMELMGVHRAVDVPEIFWAKASIWSVMYRRAFLVGHVPQGVSRGEQRPLPAHAGRVLPGHELQLQGVRVRRARGLLLPRVPALPPG